MMIEKFLWISFIVSISLPSFSQVGIYSEKDIKSQDALIAAKKEVILGNVEKAIELYKNLLDEYNEPVAAYELSRIYQMNKDITRAEGYAQRAYEGDIDNEWYLVQYGEILAENQNDLQAAELFDKYTKRHPDLKVFYLKASYHYLMANKEKDALKVLNDLERISGITEEVSQRKFEIYDVVGKPKDALKELENLSNAYPNNIRYLHNIAGYLRSTGKENEANKIMAKILALDPQDETAALFASSSGKNKDANYLRSLVPVMKDQNIDLDKKILELIPYLEDFAQNGDAELGQSLLDISLIMDEEYPNNAKIKSVLGDIYFYQKTWETAANYYKSSLQYDQSIWSVWNQLMITYSISGKYIELENISFEAIDIYPNQASAYIFNGLALLENNKLTASEASLSEAMMIGGRNPQLAREANYLLSRVNYQKKDYIKALSLIQKCMDSGQNNPFYFEHLGDVHAAMNNFDEARGAWLEAINAGGNKERINSKISGEYIFNN